MKWLFAIALLLTPFCASLSQEFNAGFVQGLWYGAETVFVGEPTRIYAAIRNNTGADLSGVVEFYVDGERIESRSVTALDGRIIESWADWEPDYGEHEIKARLTNVRLHQVGKDPKRVDIETALAEDIIFVDYDIDEDGVGNEDDPDDDGDGISDEDEEENGTDPLDPKDPAEEDESENGETDNSANTTSSGSDENERNDSGHSQPEGLEQFLTESRADTALTSLTDVINSTKRALDRYREERNSENDRYPGDENDERGEGGNATSTDETEDATDSGRETSTSTTTSSSKDGFGEVTRSKTATASSVFSSIWDLVRSLVGNLYTLVLFLLSVYLAHPVLVQITLLFLILFLVFKLAKRYGSRPG